MRKALIETPTTKQVIKSTSFHKAIQTFTLNHPHESTGTINIEGITKIWYITKNKIKFIKN